MGRGGGSGLHLWGQFYGSRDAGAPGHKEGRKIGVQKGGWGDGALPEKRGRMPKMGVLTS